MTVQCFWTLGAPGFSGLRVTFPFRIFFFWNVWLSVGLQHQIPQKIGMLNFKIIIFLHPSAFWQERDGTSRGLVWRDFGDDIWYRGVAGTIHLPSSLSGSLCPVWFWHIPRATTYIVRASIAPCCWPAGCNILISREGRVIVHVIMVTNLSFANFKSSFPTLLQFLPLHTPVLLPGAPPLWLQNRSWHSLGSTPKAMR